MTVREVHVQPVMIWANTAEEAVKKVVGGEGEQVEGFEYSHTLEPDTWTVERAPKK